MELWYEFVYDRKVDKLALDIGPADMRLFLWQPELGLVFGLQCTVVCVRVFVFHIHFSFGIQVGVCMCAIVGVFWVQMKYCGFVVFHCNFTISEYVFVCVYVEMCVCNFKHIPSELCNIQMTNLCNMQQKIKHSLDLVHASNKWIYWLGYFERYKFNTESLNCVA